MRRDGDLHGVDDGKDNGLHGGDGGMSGGDGGLSQRLRAPERELIVIIIISSRGFASLVSRSTSSPYWYYCRTPLAGLRSFSYG